MIILYSLVFLILLRPCYKVQYHLWDYGCCSLPKFFFTFSFSVKLLLIFIWFRGSPTDFPWMANHVLPNHITQLLQEGLGMSSLLICTIIYHKKLFVYKMQKQLTAIDKYYGYLCLLSATSASFYFVQYNEQRSLKFEIR